MVQNHLSRLAAPKNWPIKRKGIKFITRPNPRGYKFEESIPLAVVVEELLGYARTIREVRKIVYEGKILINGFARKDPSFALGDMDVISVPELKENYLLLKNRKGIFIITKIDKIKGKTYKILNKSLLKKGKVQLNLFDGRNILVDKDDYKTGDSIVIGFTNNKIEGHFKFEKGANIYILGGKMIGMVGKLLEIKELVKGEFNIIFESEGKKFETSKAYAFVIGDLAIKNE